MQGQQQQQAREAGDWEARDRKCFQRKQKNTPSASGKKEGESEGEREKSGVAVVGINYSSFLKVSPTCYLRFQWRDKGSRQPLIHRQPMTAWTARDGVNLALVFARSFTPVLPPSYMDGSNGENGSGICCLRFPGGSETEGEREKVLPSNGYPFACPPASFAWRPVSLPSRLLRRIPNNKQGTR